MNRCQKCQAELPKDAHYCAKCGSPQIFSRQPSSAPVFTKPETPKTIPDAAKKKEAHPTSLMPTRSVQPNIKRTPPSPTSANNPPVSVVQSASPAKKDEGIKSSAPTETSSEVAKPSALDELTKLVMQSKASQPVSPASASQPLSSAADARSSSEPDTAKRTPAPEALQFNGQDVAPKPPKPSDSSQKESLRSSSKSSGQPAVLKTQIWSDSSKPTTLPDSPKQMVRPMTPKPTQANAPKTVAKARTDSEQSAASKSKPEHDKQDLNQANIPTQLVGKPYPPDFIRPVSVTPPSKSATSTSQAQPNTAASGQFQQPQGTRSFPTTPSAQKLAAAQQGTTSSSMQTEKPAGRVRDMSQQVTHKDVTVLAQQSWGDRHAADMPTLRRGEIVRTSTLQGKLSAEELPIELEDLPVEEEPAGHIPAGFGRSSESLAATGKVAEHWRNSWRERQRAEAGPAVEVSRGQASVPMPLMAMQQSIARMRAVILNNKQAKRGRTNFTFWLTLLLMVCLIGSLGAYVLSTYMANSPFGAARVVTPAEVAEPALTLHGPQTGNFTQNSTLHLHGEHFGGGDSIALLLDMTSPLLSVQANAKGAFDVSLHISSDWSVGGHLISAQDTRTNQSAYMNIEVSPLATPETMSPNLSLSKQQLTFSAVTGGSNPNGQQVTLTNTSSQSLQWSVMAMVDNNLSWLILDPGHLRGTLDVSGTDSINVSIITAGLAGSSKPYTGQILFTINGKEQLMLPVQLYVHDPSVEVVVNPNLIIAQLVPGGACKPTTLTLINLSNKFISWSVTPYAPDRAHIHLNNKPTEQGLLRPTGMLGDTEVLALTCINVHLGEQLYHITVYYDNVPQNIPVSIRL